MTVVCFLICMFFMGVFGCCFLELFFLKKTIIMRLFENFKKCFKNNLQNHEPI